MAKYLATIDSRWSYHFENLKFSSNDFYSKVEAALKKREIPDLKMDRVNFSEGGMFSAKREYLRVGWHSLGFDICAAPFGTGFFVSWWFGELPDMFKGIPLLSKKKADTYFRLDVAGMFRESVRTGVLEAIDEIVASKGLRALSETERMFKEN